MVVRGESVGCVQRGMWGAHGHGCAVCERLKSDYDLKFKSIYCK